MSIDLPHNQRALHFTGSVKALAPERPANALGQERPKGPLPSPGRSIGAPLAPPPRSTRTHDIYLSEAQPTPYVGSRPSERAEAAKKLTTMRGQLASMDDDLLTDALDRNEIDAALFPIAKRENAGAPAPNLPVPGFRSAAEVQDVGWSRAVTHHGDEIRLARLGRREGADGASDGVVRGANVHSNPALFGRRLGQRGK